LVCLLPIKSLKYVLDISLYRLNRIHIFGFGPFYRKTLDRKTLDRKSLYRNGHLTENHLTEMAISPNRDLTETLFDRNFIWSKELSVTWFSIKWTFGQMTILVKWPFRSNVVSVKWPFRSNDFRSNGHYGKVVFG
jgi:hypothetical protein